MPAPPLTVVHLELTVLCAPSRLLGAPAEILRGLPLRRALDTFIDEATGESQLRNVLCALNPALNPGPALAFLGQWLPALAGRQHPVDVTFLETRPDEDRPQPVFPEVNAIRWHTEKRAGDLGETLIAAARPEPPDLVVITTPRPVGVLKRMRGSRLDRVLKELQLPLLSVPQR